MDSKASNDLLGVTTPFGLLRSMTVYFCVAQQDDDIAKQFPGTPNGTVAAKDRDVSRQQAATLYKEFAGFRSIGTQ